MNQKKTTLDELRTNPKCEGMDEIKLEIIANFMQADQETQDIALGILRGEIGVAVSISVLQ
jgi:hypothetical protein